MKSVQLLCGAVLGTSALLSACQDKPSASKVQPEKADAPAPARTEVAGKPGEKAAEPAVNVDRALLVQFGTLPARFESPSNPLTDEKIALGKQLYFDARISKNHDVSCASCHSLSTFGVDNKATSPGHKKQLGGRNSPTVFNAAGHFAQFWDGRAVDVEAQALGPVVNPVEMAMANLDAVEANLRNIPGYVEAFKKVFPGEAQPVNRKNFGAAVGAFERTLVTPSRFDKFLAGDDAALTNEEKRGLNTFMDVGCTTCHTGPLLGGTEFKKLGQALPWEDAKDLGRHDVTKADADKQFFKVMSLRNIAMTAPYFHDGSIGTLDEAVRLMGKHQLGKNLTPAEVQSITAFLGALTGEINPEWAKAPELPEAGPKLAAPIAD